MLACSCGIDLAERKITTSGLKMLKWKSFKTGANKSNIFRLNSASDIILPQVLQFSSHSLSNINLILLTGGCKKILSLWKEEFQCFALFVWLINNYHVFICHLVLQNKSMSSANRHISRVQRTFLSRFEGRFSLYSVMKRPSDGNGCVLVVCRQTKVKQRDNVRTH